MKRRNALASVTGLIALQIAGNGILWNLIWDSGLTDARIMNAMWIAWTIAQLALAIPVGIHLTKWGLRTFARPHAEDRLPAAWVNRVASPRSNSGATPTPRSAIISV